MIGPRRRRPPLSADRRCPVCSRTIRRHPNGRLFDHNDQPHGGTFCDGSGTGPVRTLTVVGGVL